MDFEKHWPYLAGAGLLVVLILLSRAGGSGSTEYHSIAALPDPGGDALALAKEQDRTSIAGALLNIGGTLQNTALGYAGAVGLVNAQGAAEVNSTNARYAGEIAGVNARYAGENALAEANGRTQSALARISADRDTALGGLAYQTATVGYSTAERVNMNNNATARAIADGQNNRDTTVAGYAANAAISTNATNAQTEKDIARAQVNGGIVNGIIKGITAVIPFL
jgi:hypothetical protein